MAAPEAGALVAAEGIHVFLGGLPILKDVSLIYDLILFDSSTRKNYLQVYPDIEDRKSVV